MATLGSILSTANLNNNSVVSETPGATVTVNLATLGRVRTWTAGENETVNLTGTQTAGEELILLIINDATLARTITLGTGIVSLGVIVGTASKRNIVRLISDGTNFYEASRAVGV